MCFLLKGEELEIEDKSWEQEPPPGLQGRAMQSSGSLAFAVLQEEEWEGRRTSRNPLQVFLPQEEEEEEEGWGRWKIGNDLLQDLLLLLLQDLLQEEEEGEEEGWGRWRIWSDLLQDLPLLLLQDLLQEEEEGGGRWRIGNDLLRPSHWQLYLPASMLSVNVLTTIKANNKIAKTLNNFQISNILSASKFISYEKMSFRPAWFTYLCRVSSLKQLLPKFVLQIIFGFSKANISFAVLTVFPTFIILHFLCSIDSISIIWLTSLL